MLTGQARVKDTISCTSTSIGFCTSVSPIHIRLDSAGFGDSPCSRAKLPQGSAHHGAGHGRSPGRPSSAGACWALKAERVREAGGRPDAVGLPAAHGVAASRLPAWKDAFGSEGKCSGREDWTGKFKHCHYHPSSFFFMSADVQQASPAIGPSIHSIAPNCRGAIVTSYNPGHDEEYVAGEDHSSPNDDGEHEELSETPLGAAWSCVKRISSQESQSFSLNSTGSDSFSTSSDPSDYTSSCQSGRRSLPRASSFKGSSQRPANLRVTWSPDVRDPRRSSQSHSTNGHRNRKYTISRRHEKRNAKNGKSSKSKKAGKGSGQKIISCTIVNAPAVAASNSPNPVPEPAVKEDCPSSVDVHNEDEGSEWLVVRSSNGKHRRAGETSPLHDSISTTISSGNPVSSEPLHEEIPAPLDSTRGSLCTEPSSHVKVSLDTILRQIVIDRLEGATAMAHGEFELGKSLVIASLKASQEHNFKAEEARCHRLLADTMAGAERLASLEAAVSGLSAVVLPFEQAEALLCLAQQKVAYLQLNDDSLLPLHETSATQSPQHDLMSARSDLMQAASLLTCQLASPKFQVASCTQVSTGRKKGRRGSSSCGSGVKGSALRLPELVEEERRATAVVLGSVHELWGRVALALVPSNIAEAHGCLLQAAANMDWRLAHETEAALVEALLSKMNV